MALNATTGEPLEESGPPQPKAEEQKSQNGSEAKPFVPNKETLKSREGKTIGISRGAMRALFMGAFVLSVAITTH
jgi:hypothetical protein